MQVHLKRGRARPLWARNPSVFSSSIQRVDGSPSDGDAVDVVDHRGKFIARGLWHRLGAVRVSAFTWDPEEALDGALVRRRIVAAGLVRSRVLGLPGADTDAFRLVHGAGDALPGLVVDRYGDRFAVRFGSTALESRRDEIGRILLETQGGCGVRVVREPSLRATGDDERFTGDLCGDPTPERVEFRENGLTYATDLRAGPKTGHFLDQRENRRHVAGLVRGRRVLDAFCATGGFALAAAVLGGAESVRAVDQSADALALAEENARRNDAAGIEWVRADVFADMRALEAAGERFGVVILDPPAFARTARDRESALRGYKEINLRAIGLLEPGGVLVTCSCSSPISTEDLELVLREVGMDRGIDIRILSRLSQPPDHPVLAAAPESRYLKAVVAAIPS